MTDVVAPGDDTATTRLELDPPLDVAASLRTFGRWGDDGLDRWDGRTLVRTLRLRGDSAPTAYAARNDGTIDLPALSVTFPARGAVRVDDVADAVRASFVAVPAAIKDLAAADERVALLFARHRGVVPVLVLDPFLALVRSISAQQVNLRWAVTIRRRLAERYGQRLDVEATYAYALDPSLLAAATVADLRELQLTNAKARSLIAVAAAAAGGELQLGDMARLDDEAVIGRLTQLPGIGRWSAEWFLARTLGRPRVVAGDLGVRKAVARLYGLAALPPEPEVRRLTAHWGESATVVQALALFDLAEAPGGA